MVHKILILSLSIAIAIALPRATAQSLIGSPHFLEAKNKAAEEEKPLLVHFTASWSNPCSRMFSTTYRDEKLINFLKDNLIVTLVDIDDFDGYVLGQHYSINNLPTLVLFDQNGKILKRHRGSMNAEEMLEFIDYSNYDLNDGEDLSAEESAKPGLLERINDSPNENKETPDPIVESKKQSDEIAENKGEVKNREFYSIQLGAFSELSNAEQMLQHQPEQSHSNLHVIPDGQRFLLLGGKFETRQEAESYLDQLKSNGKEGFIKKITLTTG